LSSEGGAKVLVLDQGAEMLIRVYRD